MGFIDYLVYGIIYAIIGLLIGAIVYNNVNKLSPRKRRNGAIVCGLFWPLVVGIFFAMLLEDLKDWLANGKD
jgi:hypothetical protein